MSDSTLEVGIEPASSFYIRQVQVKIQSGEYQTEEVPCICGASSCIPVTSHDRYGLPYQMNLCKACGVLYASPRLTKESYEKFYDFEYRKIFDEDGKQTPDNDYEDACENSKILKGLMEHYDCEIKRVLEVGCHTGGMLKSFQDAG